jgi:hypothetical protein
MIGGLEYHTEMRINSRGSLSSRTRKLQCGVQQFQSMHLFSSLFTDETV